MRPKVSVIMPVYNCENYIREALESILTQTYKNFELIIINDASTDKTKEIIYEYKDNRIRYYENEINMKLVRTLNRGLKLVQGEYIARMDSDDIAVETRLEEQVKLLDSNQEIAVCGSWVQFISDSGKRKENVLKTPPDSTQLYFSLLFNCKIIHPTVMIRKSSISEKDLYYNEEFEYAEDFELWNRLSMKGFKFYNIPRVLLYYRMSVNGISRKRYLEQKQKTAIIKSRVYKKYSIEESKLSLTNISLSDLLIHEEKLNSIYQELLKRYPSKKKNIEIAIYDEWYELCRNSTFNGTAVWLHFVKSRLTKQFFTLDNIKIFIKSLFKSETKN